MPLIDVFDCDNFRGMLMPRALGDSLADWGPTDAVAVGKVVYRLLKAVHYLHSQQILHGDIKPANVVLGTRDGCDPEPLLIDFGHAADLGKCGACDCRLMTCAYSAPELLGLEEHSLPSDIWGVAATVRFVVARADLLRVTHLELMREQAVNLRPAFGGDAWRRFPESFQTLLRAMLRPDPQQRPTSLECLVHPFFGDLLGADWIAREDAPPANSHPLESAAAGRSASAGDNAHR
jgi:serine/threonine protein kinase